MNLSALGWDVWLEGQPRIPCPKGCSVARVTAVDRSRYLVRSQVGEVPAQLTGSMLHQAASPVDFPCVGDWVCVNYHDDGTQALIHMVLPRRSSLKRKAAGPDIKHQMIAANIDVAFIVQSCQFDFNVRRLERYLVMVKEANITPVVLLTKTDLVSAEELEKLVARIRQMGVGERIISISNVTKSGVDQVRSLIEAGRTYCMLGSSGVGKTTLINSLIGNSALETRTVSHTGEGRHTTTRREMVMLEGGGLLIDMPGMRELGMLDVSEGISETFSDIRHLEKSCRYPDCGHATEPGCAVRASIEQGEISSEHLRNYLKLRKESEFHDSSYVERRRKDKAFGRFVHSYKKQENRRGRS